MSLPHRTGARTGHAPSLAGLAAERASGALLCDAGTVYLRDGQVVHAESPVAPGIEVLLTTGGRLTADSWREAVGRAGRAGGVGRFLVDSGRLSDAELEICHLGALFDAAYFALGHGSGPRGFRRGAAHWLGPVRPVGAVAVERETRRRGKLLAALWPYPQVDTEPVVLRRPDGRAPAVTPRQRAVLALADGVRTPARIARELGRPAFHTLIDIRRLAAAGHVATPRPTRPEHPDRSGPPARYAASAPPAPDRGPGAVVFTDPDIDLLRRLRDALEATL
ncbi:MULTISPECIES: transcriptional regulator [unclassified Streptomyces]|uniref:transcriptional regulator n=1 Tax=unclassified Streptomyces TaxID=2593676 RepID=UPI00168A78F4|nr:MULTISPECIES: transcriptional regulator [unclassified Streptomyces]MBD3002932.1 transcriptional regulator [Streptomyces sp. 5-10]